MNNKKYDESMPVLMEELQLISDIQRELINKIMKKTNQYMSNSSNTKKYNKISSVCVYIGVLFT